MDFRPWKFRPCWTTAEGLAAQHPDKSLHGQLRLASRTIVDMHVGASALADNYR
jgi:hypothetical protein